MTRVKFGLTSTRLVWAYKYAFGLGWQVRVRFGLTSMQVACGLFRAYVVWEIGVVEGLRSFVANGAPQDDTR